MIGHGLQLYGFIVVIMSAAFKVEGKFELLPQLGILVYAQRIRVNLKVEAQQRIHLAYQVFAGGVVYFGRKP